jgi:hypothetical protein
VTSRTAQKRKTIRSQPDPSDPLERSLRGRARCQCEHSTGRCGRRATHRVSVICAVRDCGCAVTVHLVCAECKDSWLHEATHDPAAPELRVTQL